MVKKTTIITLFFSLNILAFGQTFEWAKRGGLGAYDMGYSICTDNAGNVYIAGKYELNANFGGTFVTCAGNHDIYVAKYSPTGVFQWVRTAGGTIGDYARAITCDEYGNVYLTGEFETTTYFSPTVILKSHGDNDVFVAKYSTNGDLEWAKSIGGSGKSDRGYGICYSKGNVFITGDFLARAYFPGKIIRSNGDRDIFIAKYTSSGVFRWIKTFGGSGTDIGYAIDNDSEGNFFVTGFFSDRVNFDEKTVTSNGDRDIFIAKYDSNGVVQWVSQAGGKYKDEGMGIKVDKAGRIFVTGVYDYKTHFGAITLNGAGGYHDIFTACYDQAGEPLWVKGAGGRNNDYGKAIAVDAHSNTYITGSFDYWATFGEKTINGADGSEIFFASYDSSGNVRWAIGAGGIADEDKSAWWNESGLSICVDNAANVFVSGAYRSNSTFGGITLETLGHSDVYIAKIRQGPLVAQITPSDSATFCSGGSVILRANKIPGNKYSWKKDGMFIPDASNSYYKTSLPGSYVVTVVNGFETAESPPVRVFVTDNLKPVVIPGGPVSFCSDSSVLLSANIGSGYMYQWKKGQVSISGATSSSYWPLNSGEYQVKISHGPCVNWSKYTKVIVNDCPPKDSTNNKLARFKAPVSLGNFRSVDQDSLKVLLYPNPNNGLFTLEVNMLNVREETGETKIELINDMGKTIYQKNVPYYRGYIIELIDIDDTVPAGIYTLTVKAGNHIKGTRISLIK